MKRRFRINPELIEGRGGVYKIWVNGKLIWDKRAEGRFPEESEILAQVESLGS